MHRFLHRPFRGRLPPGEMFPAKDPRYRVSRVPLPTGVTLRVVEIGPRTGQPVVLIPGWGCSVYEFRELLPALANAGYRAISFDMRGHGLSDKPADPAAYGADALVADILAVLDALDLDRVVLGGHSMGAAFAVHAAVSVPQRVRGLVLIAPVGLRGVRGISVFRRLAGRRVRRLLPYAVPRWVNAIVLWLTYGRRGRPARHDVDEYWAPTQFREFAPAMADLLHEFDWGITQPAPVDRLQTPVLIVYGSRDLFLREEDLLLDAARMHDARVVRIADAGHVVAEETPGQVAAAVLEFIAQRVEWR